MKVKVTVNFKQVEFETEIEDNLSKDELEQRLSDKVFFLKEEELWKKTEAETFDYKILKEDKQC